MLLSLVLYVLTKIGIILNRYEILEMQQLFLPPFL